MDIKQLKTIKQNFVKELHDANAGKKTSLPFIVHKLSSVPIVRDGEVFQVMVIGGSIFKRALCKKMSPSTTLRGKSEISIVKKETEKQLAFRTENDFLKFIESEIDNDVNVLALNFAYPLKPVFEKGRLDGVLLAVTKEGGFHGLVGKKVGEETERYIWEKRKKRIKVAVANDTICLLMSGLSKFKKEHLAAGIVGTGFNMAFFLGEEKAVNLESANFDKFEQSKEGKLIDKESAKPGRSLFEKEIAGAYLYKHFNLIIKEGKIGYPQISSTEELNRISLERNHSSREGRPSGTPESRSNVILDSDPHLHGDESMDSRFRGNDKLGSSRPHFAKASSGGQARTITNPTVSQIAKSLLRKSAQLVACQIAGIVQFKRPSSRSSPLEGEGKDEGGGMVFNMEGSLFWKGSGYKETVEQTVKQLVPQYKVRFVEIENSAILGAAKLVS